MSTISDSAYQVKNIPKEVVQEMKITNSVKAQNKWGQLKEKLTQIRPASFYNNKR